MVVTLKGLPDWSEVGICLPLRASMSLFRHGRVLYFLWHVKDGSMCPERVMLFKKKKK